MDIMVWLAVPLGASVLAIVFAAYLARQVLANDTGTAEMRKVSDAIFTGAQAFLRRQYQKIYLVYEYQTASRSLGAIEEAAGCGRHCSV